MRRFLYFLPRLQGANAAQLNEFGLLDRFIGGGGGALMSHGVTLVNDGPEGYGAIVSMGVNPPIYAGVNWQPRLRGGFVAIENLPPRPSDLIRRIGIDGYEVMLGDANLWQVPRVHRWDAQRMAHVSNLPSAFSPQLVDGKMRYISKVRPEYQSLDALAERIFQQFAAETSISLDEAMESAAELLSTNYRIGAEEIGLLGLFDPLNAVQVLGAAIDWPALMECGKQFALNGMVLHDQTASEE